MTSGVKVSDEAYDKYLQIKMKKTHRYMIMRIEDGMIVSKSLGEKSDDQRKDFDDLIENLPKNDACYILLDMEVTGKKSGKGKGVLFIITWCPDTGITKEKMVYASSKQALMNRLNEGTTPFQANDLTDLEYEAIMEKGS